MKLEELIKHYEKYEHFVSPAGLLIGFFWHLLNLRRIDLFFDNLLVVFYLCLTGLAIIYLNAYQAGKIRGRFFEIGSIVVPFMMQFSIGGLFSSFLTFYGESGAISVSWPFLAILVFLLIGNEVFRKRYQRLTFQVCTYFAVIFLYLVFAVPILTDRLGDSIFLISGVTALTLIALFIFIIRLVAHQTVVQSWKWLTAGIAVIFLALNIFYFTNLIPPIPLSLKEGVISHSVVRTGVNWKVLIESPSWYLFMDEYDPVFHWQPGERVYCYAAVFAPTQIKTNIYHRWSFYDENSKQWVEKSKISYEITGGKDGGYRGYSYKQSIAPGSWRVDIINERGQVLGRLSFKIIQVDSPPKLTELVF
jgi:hypothetical protein